MINCMYWWSLQWCKSSICRDSSILWMCFWVQRTCLCVCVCVLVCQHVSPARHLPIYLVAAFAKKIARLCLTAPPNGAHHMILRWSHYLPLPFPQVWWWEWWWWWTCFIVILTARYSSIAAIPTFSISQMTLMKCPRLTLLRAMHWRAVYGSYRWLAIITFTTVET